MDSHHNPRSRRSNKKKYPPNPNRFLSPLEKVRPPGIRPEAAAPNASSDYSKKSGPSQYPNGVPASAVETMAEVTGPHDTFARLYPLVYEHWQAAGKLADGRSVQGSLLLLAERNRVRVRLWDRRANLVLWRCGDSIREALYSLEEHCQTSNSDWRLPSGRVATDNPWAR